MFYSTEREAVNALRREGFVHHTIFGLVRFGPRGTGYLHNTYADIKPFGRGFVTELRGDAGRPAFIEPGDEYENMMVVKGLAA